MKNINYSSEAASAYQFLLNHNNDKVLKNFITELQNISSSWSYAKKRLIISVWMKEHYPEITENLITGLVYFITG